MIAGCAARPPLPALDSVPELADTPFHAQTAYDCGPAALATVLNAAGVDITADALVDAVYVAGLEGSLQAELLAATRQRGRLPVPVAPDLESLLAEVAAGRPVLVMQNLGLAAIPRWHYAVVIGFDAEAGRVILRSGDERRRLERTRRFVRSWALADRWAFVAVAPGDIPVSATPETYVGTLVGAERWLDDAAGARAWEAARRRWPESPAVLFVTGVRAHEAGRLGEAETLYGRAIEAAPDHIAARNNLAHVLLERGCRTSALGQARRALELAAPGSEFHAAVADTLAEIESAPRAGSDGALACEAR